jgi:putative phosphoribosyl transferase
MRVAIRARLRRRQADAITLMTQEIVIAAAEAQLCGSLEVPAGARGVVLFAHGSGSGRHSPRNRRVAQHFNGGGLATLLFDMLTPAEEEADRNSKHYRFDVELLADRLQSAARWLGTREHTGGLPMAFYGASTGAAACLAAAAELGASVHAVVSRGGRPDLAGDALPRVVSPTLLIVGSRDMPVIELNEDAYERLRCRKRLSVIPGASHVFEEPGTLDEVAILAQSWFDDHLPAPTNRGERLAGQPR